MSHFSLPPDEAARMAALRRYDVLDTPPEERFDRVTRLATEWLDVPIAMVTLVADDRVWLKSCAGVCRGESNREDSFCAHNLQGEDLLVVEDATQDPRFAENPFVTGDPGIRFYAGAPLITPDGYILGSLCVVDMKPREADAMPLAVLQDLAAIVVDELELRVANQTLRERNRQVQSLTRELQKAEESDRSQLSQLLQEELQQILQATRMKLENVAGNETLLPDIAERLDEVTQNLDDAVDVIQTLSARFAPPVGNQPLRESLEWLALKMEEVHGLSVSVLGSGTILGGGEMSASEEEVKTLLYRLVRELLLRIVKHTGTGEARVYLVETAGHLRITVEDDGQGTDPIEYMENGENGLTDLRRQVEDLGGRVALRSHSGAGPCVVIEIPQSKPWGDESGRMQLQL